MLDKLKKLVISDKEVFPIIEGGKGIAATNWRSAGAFAKENCVGTMSGVNTSIIDENGEVVEEELKSETRIERHLEMVENTIKGIISQAKRAVDISKGNGRIHLNVLWEQGGTEKILHGVLDKTRGLINGVVCGAGLPYKLSEIASRYSTYYYPIVSSMKAFRVLWIRSYQKTVNWLGGVVYECPWRAGGHNGLSNKEDPYVFGDSYTRVVELRKYMNEIGLQETPIIMAGGVWDIKEYEHWLDNPEIGKIAFQFGTRPLVTKESPIPDGWKEEIFNLKEGDIKTNKFSPTGFYSSAVMNDTLKDLFARSERQVEYRSKPEGEFSSEILCGARKRKYYVKSNDKVRAEGWMSEGQTEAMKTPDDTIVFVTREKAEELTQDRADCIGCLSQCQFSSWSQNPESENYSTGQTPDARSFCIQKALQRARQWMDGTKLLFSGSSGYRFAIDELYKNKYIPSTKELVEALLNGK